MHNKLVTLLNLILLFGINIIPSISNIGNREMATMEDKSLSWEEIQQTNLQQSMTEDQGPWMQYYGGSDYDTAVSVVQTNDGGYAFTGGTGIWPDDKAWLVKTDILGNVQWTQEYNFSYANKVIQTTNGGYALTGTQGGYSGGNSSVILVKTDYQGEIIWEQIYDEETFNEPGSVIQTKDGDFLHGGSSSKDGGNWEGWLLKISDSGNIVWMRTYGGDKNDIIHGLIETTDGYAFTGATESNSAGFIDAWLVLVDASGNTLWNQTYGGVGYDRTYDVIQMADKSFYLIGTTSSYGSGEFDAWLLHVDANGNSLWNQTYGGATYDAVYSGILVENDSFVLAGATETFTTDLDDRDAWLIKVDAKGTILWNHTYGGFEDDRINSVVQAHNGGFILAGVTSSSTGRGKWDALLIKTNNMGVAPFVIGSSTNWFVRGLVLILFVAATVAVYLWAKSVRKVPKWR